MTVEAWTFVLVGISFALYIGVAIWSRARSTGDFYVAGGEVSPVVNGAATPVLRANGVFRAVRVPGGETEVALRFDPPSLRVGAWITLVSLLTFALTWTLARRRLL